MCNLDAVLLVLRAISRLSRCRSIGTEMAARLCEGPRGLNERSIRVARMSRVGDFGCSATVALNRNRPGASVLVPWRSEVAGRRETIHLCAEPARQLIER